MALPSDGQAPLSTPSHLAEHQRVSDAVAALQVPTWIALPFTNAWGNYGAGYELGAYCKVNNFVYLQGLIISGTAVNVFTLPIGYRPVRTQLGKCLNVTTAGILRWDISTAGVFTVAGSAPTAGSLTIEVTGLMFSTTALP